MGEDKNTLVFHFAVQPLALLHEYKHSSDTKGNGKDTKADKETNNHITHYEADNTTPSCGGGPIDITALKTHKLKRTLKSLEYGKFLRIGNLGIHTTHIYT